MSPSDQRIKYIRCIVTFNRAACFRAARQSTPVEFDYSCAGIGVGVGDDHDDDVDERKASSRMLVFPSILVRSAESPDGDFDSTPPCILRVEMHLDSRCPRHRPPLLSLARSRFRDTAADIFYIARKSHRMGLNVRV